MYRMCIVAALALGCGPSYTVLDTPDEAIDPALVTCEADRDCTLVEMDCCNTCNGGWKMSVRTDQVAAARTRWASDCAGGITCTLLDCHPADVPVCVQNRCATLLPLFDKVVHNPRLRDPKQPGWPRGVGPHGRDR